MSDFSFMENWIDLFTYKRRERRGIIVLFSLIIILVLVTLYASEQSKRRHPNLDASLEQEYEKLLQSEKIEFTKNELTVYPKHQKQADTIEVVKRKKHTSKTVVLEQERVNVKRKIDSISKKISSQKIESTKLKIDVNKASASEFAQLKGIGQVLSNRIVNYRNKLGGFVSVDQVGTTYGIEKQVFLQLKSQLIIDETTQVDKLNFNTASAEMLANHPYISEKLANQIVNFRTKVKPYETFNDIKKLYYFKNQPELLKKIKPYITF